MQSHSSRDAFYYLLQFVTLAISSIALGNLWFALINRWTHTLELYSRASVGDITNPLSAMIIASPIYLLLSWWIHKSFATQSMSPTSGLRKWLTYLTLFVTAIIWIVDLITTLNTYLNGEFTANFLYKALTVFIIVTAIFSFYLWDIRRETPTPTTTTRWAMLSAIVVLIVSVIAGFIAAGSPQTRRLYRWDSQRETDLINAANAIINHQLRDLTAVPENQEVFLRHYVESDFKDPQTNQFYEYHHVSDTLFDLCATFAFPDDSSQQTTFPRMPKPYYPDDVYYKIQNHGAGHQCFSFQLQQQPLKPTP